MADSTPADSPLEEAAGAAGPHTVDAFRLLSDETRLAILLALWEADDPHAEDDAVPFSSLFDRVGVCDSGNFSYHLDRLVGHFVEETPDGYRLRHSGRRIVRAVIAGAGLDTRRLPPTEIPRACDHCGAPVELSYGDERLYQICTGCEGNIGPGSTERAPKGTLVVYDDFNPAGLAHRTADEVFVAGTIEYFRAVSLLIRGVCPECSGPVEESLHVCESHEGSHGELCPSCDTAYVARASYVCSVCKHGGSYPAWVAVYDHPSIVAFYHAHGKDMTYGLDDPEACGRLWARRRMDQTLVSDDPVRIRVTVSCDGAALYLTLDGSLDVVDVTREDGGADPSGPADPGPPVSGHDRPSAGGDVDGDGLPDPEDCLRRLRRRRWPDGVRCPHCDSPDTIRKGTTGKGAQRYRCHDCGGTFNDLTGTLFAGHRLTLPEMFHIVREMDGTETARIARRLDRSYKSVLAFVHEVRDARDGGADPTVLAAASS